MEKFLKILRMTLKKVYVALGVTAMPFLVHAAYGMREPDPSSLTVPVQGRVVSEETGEPVAGISISVWSNGYVRTNTDNDGRFFIYLPEENTYSISFTDIDGFENNGYFSQKQVSITREEIGNSLEISLYRENNVAIVRGTVLSKETGEPASGIRISISSIIGEIEQFGGITVISDDSGQFYTQVPERNTYFLSFSDTNGLFRYKTINVTSDEIKNLLTVDLEKINR
jgi:5-hydroxyisourate hydrolase-like protein (transthyretin family)